MNKPKGTELTRGLLAHTFYPITATIGFLNAPLDDVILADRTWKAEIGEYDFDAVNGTLPQLLANLLPLTGPQTRNLWVSAEDQWTAYFDNFRQGSDPYGPIDVLAKRLGCRGLIVANCPPERVLYGSRQFHFYDPKLQMPEGLRRSLSATDDGGRWVWHAIGEPLMFEDLATYERKRIRDKLTPEMLDQYCRAVGVRPFDEDFFGSKGSVVTNCNIKQSVPLEESLLDAQKRILIK